MREHAPENNIWAERQLGAVDSVQGTVDQLIIDNCIMEEVKTQVYEWIGTRYKCMSGLAYRQQSFHY